MSTARPTRALTCFECVRRMADRQAKGRAKRAQVETAGYRIGNRKNECGTCNRFAQAVRREIHRRLKDEYPERFEELRTEIEKQLWREYVEAQS